MEQSYLTGKEGDALEQIMRACGIVQEEMQWTQMPPMEAVFQAMEEAEQPQEAEDAMHWTQMPPMSAVNEAMDAVNRYDFLYIS